MHEEVAETRTTLVLDDDLLAEAQRLTGVKEKTLLVREGLSALIERESARRLARPLWTRDRRLHVAAQELQLAYTPNTSG